MKLLFIVDKYPPQVDGVGDYTHNLVKEYIKRGHNVCVVCSKNNDIKHSSSENPSVFAVVKKWNSKEFQKVINIVNDESPDWVLLQYVPYSFQKKGMPVWLPGMLKRIRRDRTKILIRIHEPFIRLQIWPAKLLVLGLVQRFIIKQLGNQADKIVASTDLYKKLIDAYSIIKTDIVPIGSNILPVKDVENKVNFLKRKIAPNGEKIVSTFGIRDHHLLLEVFKIIIKKYPDFKLLVCGIVRNHDLYDSIKDKVYVTGFLSSDEIYIHLRCSNVFFMPDEMDARGKGGTSNKSTALAAGLAADLPVVGIKGDMNNELLKKNTSIYLENANDPSSISRRIVELAFSNNYKNESYLFWQAYLSWDKIVDQYNLK